MFFVHGRDELMHLLTVTNVNCANLDIGSKRAAISGDLFQARGISAYQN